MYDFDTTSSGVDIVICAFALHLMHNYLHRMHLKDFGVAICQFPVWLSGNCTCCVAKADHTCKILYPIQGQIQGGGVQRVPWDPLLKEEPLLLEIL